MSIDPPSLRTLRQTLRVSAFGLCALALTGCAAEHVWADDDFVARSVYVAPGPATVTLITSVNPGNNTGTHSALLIDGAQRLLFDPAGHWTDPGVPERNDVWYGMTPAYMDRYLAFQSEGQYEVFAHTVTVSPAVAQQLSQVVQSAGPVASFYCSQTISGILSTTPGFEHIGQTFIPTTLMNDFAATPGATTEIISEVGVTSG
ncbi:hypothetical protein [Gymnodinialimonas sp.]